jgi:hypothetical protein
MVLDAQNDKLDAKDTIYLFLGYYERTKAFILMCLQTKNIIKIEMWCSWRMT